MRTTASSKRRWVKQLKRNEARAIVYGLGSLAFLRSQGRTLQKRSQFSALKLFWQISRDLHKIRSGEEFEERHRRWVLRAIRALRTNRNQKLVYGQGQKSINVFLKFYVDWSSRPTASIANRLRPWLHCPLDKVVMENLHSRFHRDWQSRIWDEHYAGRGISSQQRFSMSKIDEATYHGWQSWIRELSEDKPVLIDTVWS